MLIKRIVYSKDFLKDAEKIPSEINFLAIEKEKQFLINPFNNSLRMHPLKGKAKGLWSISINLKYRIIFEPQNNGDILFISIGKHDIYRNL